MGSSYTHFRQNLLSVLDIGGESLIKSHHAYFTSIYEEFSSGLSGSYMYCLILASHGSLIVVVVRL